MKKILAIVLSTVLATGIFTSCAAPAAPAAPAPVAATAQPETEATAEAPAETPAKIPLAEADGSQIANPWTEAKDDDELETLSGVDINDSPDGATNVVYSFLEADMLAQVSFTWNGDDYTYRAVKGQPKDDITGMMLDFKDKKDVQIDNDGDMATIQYNGEGKEGTAVWYDKEDDTTYSVSSSTAGTEQKMNTIALEMS